MWSSDSDLELLDMLSDWSDLSSDEDSNDAIRHYAKKVDYISALNKNAPEVPDDLSMFDEDDAPSLSRDSQSKGEEESLFNEYHCNVCNKTITEFRYTCVQCSDLDLCGACEAARAHHHHYVLRVPADRHASEVRFVLATIRRHLMKRLDPITEPEQDRDDVISVKSEIKMELENNDDFENNCEDENNGDDENSDDDNTDDDSSNDDNNDNDESNENIVDVETENTSYRENTVSRSAAIAKPDSKPLDTREISGEVSVKKELKSQRVKQLGASSVASTRMSLAASSAASPVASPPAAVKRKILIRRSDIINVKDFSTPGNN